MAGLKPTDFVGKIAWLGFVPEGKTPLLSADPLQEMQLDWGGYPPEVHHGATRPSCVRVTDLYEIGTEIRNVRQVSILSAEEMAAIAGEIGLDTLDPGWLGASMVVEGIPDFTHLPPSSRLQSVTGATLVVDMLNAPCLFPAKAIEAAHPGKGKRFKPAAKGRRGVTAWVERPGLLRLNDTLRVYVPDQRPWAP